MIANSDSCVTMDTSFLDHTSLVALCGTIPDTVLSFLELRQARIVTWSNKLSALICGDDHESKWKYKTAVARGIRCIDIATLCNVPSELIVDSYKPRELRDIIGNAEQIRSVITWLKDWSQAMTTPRAIFLSGPPGIGKTTAAHLVANACGYGVIELNASNERSAGAVKAWFETASKSACVGKHRVVIMDEVDGMSSGDRGGVGALAAIVKSAAFPIICIANERSGPRLRPLVSACLEIRFQRPPKGTIAKALHERVCVPLKLPINLVELENYVEKNGNDIRQVLNFLQFNFISSARGGGGGGGSSAATSAKDSILRMDPFSAAGSLFGSSTSRGGIGSEDRANLVYLDSGLVPLMIAEGYVAAAGRGNGDDAAKLARCVAAADLLGAYDMIDTRIRKVHNWALLPSAVSAVVSAAAAAGGPAPFQLFPSWLGKSSKARKQLRWHRDMAYKLNTDSGTLLDARELLRARLWGEPDAESICNRLEEYGLTRDDMMETLAESVFSGDEKSVAMDTKLKGGLTRAWKKRRAAAATATAAAAVLLAEPTADDDYVSSDEDDYLLE